MQVKSLGNVVLRVTDLERSEKFYHEVLGLPVCAHFNEQGLNMAFFTLGNHHDLAISEVKGAERSDDAPGLDHVAFCIGTSLDELRDARAHLEAAGISMDPIDHEVTKSLYFNDPDGNTIEVYVDVSDVWKEEPQRVAQVAPLTL